MLMRISTRSSVVVAALAATTIATSFVSVNAADDASSHRHVVEIHKFRFIPAQLDVSPGDTIVWINRDIVPHTVTADNKSWDSGAIKKDDEWQIIVRNNLSGDYFCRFHPAMKARIQSIQ